MGNKYEHSEFDFDLLRLANTARQKEWDKGNQVDIAYRGNELAGEVGEACNIIKKLKREALGMPGTRATRLDLARELADVIICADLIAMAEGIDLGSSVIFKFNETTRKVGLTTTIERQEDTCFVQTTVEDCSPIVPCSIPHDFSWDGK